MSLLSLSHPPEISTWGFGLPARRQVAWPSLPTGQATSSGAPPLPASLVHDYMHICTVRYSACLTIQCVYTVQCVAGNFGEFFLFGDLMNSVIDFQI